jgi:hypothetical protein
MTAWELLHSTRHKIMHTALVSHHTRMLHVFCITM